MFKLIIAILTIAVTILLLWMIRYGIADGYAMG